MGERERGAGWFQFSLVFFETNVQSLIMGCREKGCEFSLDFLPQISYDLECREKERFLDRATSGKRSYGKKDIRFTM